jgi:hypothetical protein
LLTLGHCCSPDGMRIRGHPERCPASRLEAGGLGNLSASRAILAALCLPVRFLAMGSGRTLPLHERRDRAIAYGRPEAVSSVQQ